MIFQMYSIAKVETLPFFCWTVPRYSTAQCHPSNRGDIGHYAFCLYISALRRVTESGLYHMKSPKSPQCMNFGMVILSLYMAKLRQEISLIFRGIN